MAATKPTFRFMELPGEIRNHIYRELLCSFDYEYYPNGYPNQLARILRQETKSNGVHHISHSIDTNILLVSRTVHREAYDIMVKTNRFIRIQSWNYNLSTFLVWSQLPVVTMDRQHTAQFEGYVLQMYIECFLQGDDPGGSFFDCKFVSIFSTSTA